MRLVISLQEQPRSIITKSTSNMNAQTFNNLPTVKKRVELLLSRYDDLRDSDNKLITIMWYHEIGIDKCHEMSAIDFLQMFSEGKLTSAESIRRCRQKLQEENEHLRGKMYSQRKTDGEVIRTKINQL